MYKCSRTPHEELLSTSKTLIPAVQTFKVEHTTIHAHINSRLFGFLKVKCHFKILRSSLNLLNTFSLCLQTVYAFA